jgi:hypothetical protein
MNGTFIIAKSERGGNRFAAVVRHGVRRLSACGLALLAVSAISSAPSQAQENLPVPALISGWTASSVSGGAIAGEYTVISGSNAGSSDNCTSPKGWDGNNTCLYTTTVNATNAVPVGVYTQAASSAETNGDQLPIYYFANSDSNITGVDGGGIGAQVYNTSTGSGTVTASFVNQGLAAQDLYVFGIVGNSLSATARTVNYSINYLDGNPAATGSITFESWTTAESGTGANYNITSSAGFGYIVKAGTVTTTGKRYINDVEITNPNPLLTISSIGFTVPGTVSSTYTVTLLGLSTTTLTPAPPSLGTALVGLVMLGAPTYRRLRGRRLGRTRMSPTA